jgi:tetratricopeptide (TPR) repeat protein
MKDDNRSIFPTLYEHGQILFRNQQYIELIHYFEKMMTIYDFLKSDEYACRIFWDLGRSYEELEDCGSAIFFYELTLEYWARMNEIVKRHVYYRLGYTSLELGLLKKSLYYLQKARNEFDCLNDNLTAEECDYVIACIYMKCNQPEVALSILEKILPHNAQLYHNAQCEPDLEPLKKNKWFVSLQPISL